MTTLSAPDASARRIVALALPALVVLAAEPLYVLVDTAVVGHLGRIPLAGLALGGTIMSVAAALANFLAYGTTGRAARRYGAGDRPGAVAEGVQASWLAVALGLAFVLLAQVLAAPVTRLLAGGGPDGTAIAAGAAEWLRIASFGVPGVLLTLAGNGWLRGVQDTRRPLLFVLFANLLSAALGPVLVYGAGLGLRGSALANVTAQALSAALFVVSLLRERTDLRPRPAILRAQLAVGRDLVMRTLSMQLCFTSAAAVAARFGAASVGAHQIALQLWNFCALLLDSVAIAAQSLVGADLGAGRIDDARTTARRIGIAGAFCGTALAVVIGAGAPVLPEVFSSDAAVHHQAMLAWPWFVGLLPFAGVVFALDGVLIGAGDVGYLRNLTLISTLAGFLPAIWLAYALHLGLGGVWAGLGIFILLRFALILRRTITARWAIPNPTPRA